MRIKLDIDCPECGSEVLATLDDVAQQRVVRCARGHRIVLIDDGGGARKVNRSLNDLERTLRRLGQ
jgi:DNA-directed RNA polymerase subunit RPC12/RpoP